MRYHYMDLLRGALMAVGVIYHTALVVSPSFWEINTHQSHDIYTGLHLFIHSFRMQAFFLISGFFAAMLLRRMSQRDYLSKRLTRILIPLCVCAFSLNLVMYRGYDWNVEFWLGGKWLGHLWFLAHLTIYMISIALVHPLLHKACIRLPYPIFALAISAFYMCATAVTWSIPAPPYGSSWFIIDIPQLLPHSLFFFAGYYLFFQQDLFERFHNLKLNIPLATISGTILVLYGSGTATIIHLVAGLWALSFTGVLMGAARILIRRPGSWIRFLADSSYTLYLFHQPLLVATGFFFLDLNPHLFFIAFSIWITLFCWLLHGRVISKSHWLLFLFNGKPLPESDQPQRIYTQEQSRKRELQT